MRSVDWTMVTALMTGALALAGLVNVREWARETFADKALTEKRLERLDGEG